MVKISSNKEDSLGNRESLKDELTKNATSETDGIIGKKVSDLGEGEVGYVIPWCIFPNIFMGGEIAGRIEYTTRPFGTSNQLIKKQGDVILVEKDIIWRRLSDKLSGSIGDPESGDIPIKIVKKIEIPENHTK